MSERMPGGLVLAASERVVQTCSFMFSLAHFFLGSKFILTDKRLAGERPNTLWGLIPIGTQKVSYPLANIASVGTNTQIQFGPLLLGGILLLVGLAGLIPLALVGLFLVVGAFQAGFVVANNAGQTIAMKISLFQKGAAQAFADQINTTIAERL